MGIFNDFLNEASATHKWVIFGGVDEHDGQPLFWSNKDGWVSLPDATKFSESEKTKFSHIPKYGKIDSRWVPLSKEYETSTHFGEEVNMKAMDYINSFLLEGKKSKKMSQEKLDALWKQVKEDKQKYGRLKYSDVEKLSKDDPKYKAFERMVEYENEVASQAGPISYKRSEEEIAAGDRYIPKHTFEHGF